MKIITFILTLILMNSALAELRSGDIVLLPMSCYECKMIEAETNGPFAHSGLIVKTDLETYVLQSLGSVHAVTLESFLKMKDPTRDIVVVRPKEFQGIDMTSLLIEEFEKNYKGLPFDHEYLWNNFNESNIEKLYCSEFITKILNKFLITKITPTPMTYYAYPEYWEKFFNGDVPNGALGNSPNSFYSSTLFSEVPY